MTENHLERENYYVNSSTGEKSGTMLAEVAWSAAAAGGEP